MSFLKDLKGWLDQLRGKGPAAAVALTLDLGEARDNKPYALEAGGLIVESCGGDLYARINGPNGDGLNLRCVHRILYPVTSLFLTNTAQTGKSARLLLLPTGMDTDVIGDMARKAHYDRTPTTIARQYQGSRPTEFGWAEVWSYTVPTGRMYQNLVGVVRISPALNLAGRFCMVKVQILGTYVVIFKEVVVGGLPIGDSMSLPFMLKAGENMGGYCWNYDDINHDMLVGCVGIEFDA